MKFPEMLTGVQHIGVPTNDLKRPLRFTIPSAFAVWHRKTGGERARDVFAAQKI